MRVKAKRAVVYGDVRKKEGDLFDVPESVFNPDMHEPVGDEAEKIAASHVRSAPKPRTTEDLLREIQGLKATVNELNAKLALVPKRGLKKDESVI